MTTANRSTAPLPWSQVALAVLPGLFVAGAGSGLLPLGRSTVIVGLVILCAVLGVAGLVRDRRPPAWSLAALGVVVAAGLFAATAVFAPGNPAALLWPLLAWLGIVYLLADREVPRPAWFVLCLLLGSAGLSVAQSMAGAGDADRLAALQTALALELWWTALLLAPIVAGLPLVRRHGLAAGLLVVGALCLLAQGAIGPLVATPGHAALALLPGALPLVAAPVWLFRARSARAQLAALLLPATAGLLVTCTLCLSRPPAAGGAAGLLAAGQLGLALVIMVLIYGREALSPLAGRGF